VPLTACQRVKHEGCPLATQLTADWNSRSIPDDDKVNIIMNITSTATAAAADAADDDGDGKTRDAGGHYSLLLYQSPRVNDYIEYLFYLPCPYVTTAKVFFV